ncbi:hypothetical protein MUK42_34823 [Musa troglodytarum]|uniref:Uncharacterized protein n=1 Tax=Musa troglodytarum TaxID=320322 RepID=A0A9E7E7T3_9LILI|nr:hypothetical protein MUK42_34823 [Musa troglodytarum]
MVHVHHWLQVYSRLHPAFQSSTESLAKGEGLVPKRSALWMVGLEKEIERLWMLTTTKGGRG